MASEQVGKGRRSSLVSTFGVGSLFPTEDDSVMIAGLENWRGGEEIVEPRLADSLGVSEFRTPPSGMRRGDVPVVRFPEAVFCSKCRRVGKSWEIASRNDRRCRNCNEKVSPSRFVACCTNGHIEDFPYFAWAHPGGADDAPEHKLSLISRGHTSALSDLLVKCSCGRARSMDGAFQASALQGVKSCYGSRPWLIGAENEECTEPLRTLQRGSSNVWFAIVRSTISIPSVADAARKYVQKKFAGIDKSVDPAMAARMFTPPKGITPEQVEKALRDYQTPAATRERPTDRELRAQEYTALVQGFSDASSEHQFLCEEVDLDDTGLPEIVAQVSRVGRLREVRALTGFTRVKPVNPEQADLPVAPLSATRLDWLPAIEVLGEGVFVRLDEDLLAKWCASAFAVERAGQLLQAQESAGSFGLAASMQVSPRVVVLHSMAHMLIEELSLNAGYPAASLRERLYHDEGQAGVLIYTATADGAGSLGGLAAQSDGQRFAGVLESAIERARWCTADPVCCETTASGVSGLNLAACHACLLLPETSCESFNLMLDRASLIGLPGQPRAGLFS